jgi:hypothetical protein
MPFITVNDRLKAFAQLTSELRSESPYVLSKREVNASRMPVYPPWVFTAPLPPVPNSDSVSDNIEYDENDVTIRLHQTPILFEEEASPIDDVLVQITSEASQSFDASNVNLDDVLDNLYDILMDADEQPVEDQEDDGDSCAAADMSDLETPRASQFVFHDSSRANTIVADSSAPQTEEKVDSLIDDNILANMALIFSDDEEADTSFADSDALPNNSVSDLDLVHCNVRVFKVPAVSSPYLPCMTDCFRTAEIFHSSETVSKPKKVKSSLLDVLRRRCDSVSRMWKGWSARKQV